MLTLAAAGSLALTACADAPTAPDAAAPVAARAAAAPPGTYELTFHVTGSYDVDVPSAPVGTEVGVRATVRNSLGALVKGGTVTFERCELGGSPAASAACDGGLGTWKRFIAVRIDASGFPPIVSGGFCTNPTSIGFRFRYSPQGESGIASGVSASRDFTWVAAG